MSVLPPDPVFSLRCSEMNEVHSICFEKNERLYAGTIKGKLFIWDLQTNRSTLHFEIGTQPITSLHNTRDYLISQEKGGAVTIGSLTNEGYIRKRSFATNHTGFCRTTLYTTNTDVGEELLFYPLEENSIGVLHVNDMVMPPQILVPDEKHFPKLGVVCCLKAFEYGSQVYLLAGYESGHFLTWDLNSGVAVDLLELDASPMALDYDTATNRGIVGGASDKLTAISYQRQSMQLRACSNIVIKNAGINCIRIRNDKKVFCTGGWDGRLRIFSWKSLRPLAVLTEHKTGGIMDIAYTDMKVDMWNAPLMAAGGQDGQITLWDLYN